MQQINQDRRHHLLSLSKRLNDIAIERRPLLLRLETLEKEERALKRECALLHNLDAPTSNCPDEILALIFEAGLPGRLERGPKVMDIGIIVSHVSQRWRRIALATPKLWATIQCFQYSPTKRAERKHRERAAVFLSRSRSSPVHIRINGHSLDQDGFTQATDFLDLINSHMGHCRHLRIERVPGEIMPMLLESFSRQPVPLLRSIRLGANAGITLQHSFLSLGAPRLTTVQLTGMDTLSLHFCLSAFSSVTSLQLTSLNISQRERFDSFRVALMSMAALTHLELETIAVTQEPVQPVVLPNLRLLAVDFEVDPPGMSAIIKFIHAPSLVSLSLTGWDPNRESLDSSVVGEANLPALQHLIIGSPVEYALSEFELLAQVFPNIERLTCLVEYLEIGDILANITEPGDELRWPKLQSIAISKVYRALDAKELGDLCQLIIELQQAGRPFRQLSYPTSESCVALVGAKDIHKLRELVELEDFRDDWPTPFE